MLGLLGLAVVLSGLTVLSTAPGIAFAPTTVLFAAALVTVAAYTFAIVPALLSASRRAYA